MQRSEWYACRFGQYSYFRLNPFVLGVSLFVVRPSTLLLNTQTQREAMGHLSKYYPIRSHSSGVSNQGRTRHHDTLLVVRRNKPV